MKRKITTPLFALIMLGSFQGAYAQSETSVENAKNCVATTPNSPRLFIWDYQNLEQNRNRLNAQDKTLLPAYNAVIKKADQEMSKPPYSVTQKTKTPPSGDKHDYYSIGPYWWPNPKTKNALPYVRRDGETNPERYDNSFDSDRFSDFANGVEALTIAAFFSRKDEYANKAAEFIRTWFINPETRMNPHMDYSQAIPGKTDGRGIGIIDSYRFVRIIDSIGLLEQMGAFSPAEVSSLQKWFEDYSLWMLTSKNGKESRSSTNNHGIFFDVQLMTFSAFAGDLSAVEIILKGVKSSRIAGQINKKGQLPHELRRTRAFHYTAYALRAFFDAADLGECVGVDLWNFKTRKKQGLKPAMAYQTKFANNMKLWPFKEIRKYVNQRGYYQNLLRADEVYEDINFTAPRKKLGEKYKEDISNLLYP
jgi:hypothetical protein